MPKWAAAAAIALEAEAGTGVGETGAAATAVEVGTAKGDDETARRHKTLQQDGSRGSTTP